MKDTEKKKKNSVSKVKETKKKKEKKVKKESYLKRVNKELKLVKWPSAKEVIKYTISTIVFCLILCALFMLLTYVLSEVKGGL